MRSPNVAPECASVVPFGSSPVDTTEWISRLFHRASRWRHRRHSRAVRSATLDRASAFGT